MKTYLTKCGVRKRYPVRVPFNIRNWFKIRGEQDAWENTKTYSSVSIEKIANKFYVDERFITSLNIQRRRRLSDGVTKKEAKKIAFRYMRQHSDFK